MKVEFNKFAQDAAKFVSDVALDLETTDDNAYRSLKVVFHTLREVITPEESMHVVAQLPMFLKALYVDNWKLNQSSNYKKLNDKVDFFNEFNLVFQKLDNGPHTSLDEAQNTFTVIFKHLSKYISEGELKHVISQLPEDIKEMIPA